MKYLFLLLPLTLAAQQPLWLEEPHFCQYRTLHIENSVYMTGALIKEARKYPEAIDILLDAMEQEMNNAKQALYHDTPSNS